MKTKKILISSMLSLIVLGTVGTSFASAAQVTNSEARISVSSVVPTGEEILWTDVDINDIVLINGVAYDSNGSIVVDYYHQSYQRGKYSTIAKKLLKSYNKWPGWVKAIVGYGVANNVAKALDKANGNLIDVVTVTLNKIAFIPIPTARQIAKIIIGFVA